MPHSLVHRFLAAVFAAIILIVPTDSLAQASPYPVGRATISRCSGGYAVRD